MNLRSIHAKPSPAAITVQDHEEKLFQTKTREVFFIRYEALLFDNTWFILTYYNSLRRSMSPFCFRPKILSAS